MQTLAEPSNDESSAALRGGVQLRRCLATGETRSKAELLRFVVAPDRSLVLDLGGRLPGRGMWLSPRRDVLEKACARNLFAKAAKAAVRVEPGFAARVEDQVRARCLELLGLARRAGQAVAGFEKVKARLSSGQAAVLLQARDGAQDGRSRLALLGSAAVGGLRRFDLFETAELGQVFGRTTAVHVAVAPGGLAERIIVHCEFLAGVSGAGNGPDT